MDKKQIINDLLVDLFNRILRIEEDALKNSGVKLSMTEVHVLEAIEQSENKAMSDVANKLNVTLGTLTTSVNGLIRKGYVNKKQNHTDRRVYNLSLTDNGLNVLTIHDKFHHEMIQSLIDDLMVDEDEVLITSLQNISNYFKNIDEKQRRWKKWETEIYKES